MTEQSSRSAPQIVFIDGSMPDADLLLAGVQPGVIAVLLDPGQDGLQQIADYLAAYQAAGGNQLGSISIVAHGSDGAIELGSTQVSAATLAGQQTLLTQIGGALAPGGDIQLYACDVAQDAAGQAFLDQLSQATGADIAASSHLVGAADLGGSWVLDAEAGAGTIAPATPFTAQTLAAFPDLLPVGTNQLFADFDSGIGQSLTRVVQLGVSGSTLFGSAINVRDGTQTTNFAFLQGLVVNAPLGKYDVVNSDNGTVNQIVSGNVTGGANTVVYSAPDIDNYEFAGMALDQPGGQLYFAQASNFAAQNGIYRISIAGGTPTAMVVGQGITSPLDLALDLPDNLVFFVDNYNGTINNLDVGNLTTGVRTILNSQFSAAVQADLATNAGQLTGVAVDVTNRILYFTAESGSNAANNFIFKVPYTVSGGGVTLGTVTTLYSGANAAYPGSITIDPTAGVFYIASKGTAQSIQSGSLTGTGAISKVYQLSTGVQPDGVFLLSTPTVTAGTSPTFIQGGSAITINAASLVTNPDGQQIASATVDVLGSFTGDTLAAVTTGTSIVASYAAATETLTLTGADTASHYQTVLRSITFSSNGATAGLRTLNWTVSDGIISSTTPTSTVNVHVKPVVTAGASATFNGGDPAVTLDAALTVADASSTTLASATVVLGGFITGDVLTSVTHGSLTANYSNGTLTLTGVATLAVYQTALASVTYSFSPGNADPTGGGSHTSRTLSWTVDDGTVASASAGSTLSVVHVAPTITAGGTVTYNTGDPPVVLGPTVTVSDPNIGGNLASATVTLGNLLAGDTLNFTALGGITGIYTSGTGQLALTGTATLASYQAVLRSVTYSFVGDPSGGHTDNSRTISWVVNDGVASSASATSALTTLCFAAGTRIASATGQTVVEALRAGDLVRTLGGELRPVLWVGCRRIDASLHPAPETVRPIRIRAGALADGIPARDLRVSPDHAMFLDGGLVPARLLVNGASIVRETDCRRIAWYHVELDTHDVLLAEGAAAESYLDTGNRGVFENAMVAMVLHPNFEQNAGDRAGRSCAPFFDRPEMVQPIWQRLADRAAMRGLALSEPVATTSDPEISVQAGGRRFRPASVANGVYVFALPALEGDIRLVSRSTAPATLLPWLTDRRELGLAVRRVTLRRATAVDTIPPDHPALGGDVLGGSIPAEGWWGVETDGVRMWRWTDGDAKLPIRLPEPSILEIETACAATYTQLAANSAPDVTPSTAITRAAA